MRVLLVTCHPEEQSLNFALRDRALDVLQRQGHDIRISDLSQENFSLALDHGDFPSRSTAQPLRILDAQLEAVTSGEFSPDIQVEQEKLEWCDLLIVQFPLWWASYPATLKGWIDRVLSYGFAYGRSHTLPAKTVLYSVTVGTDDDEDLLEEDRQRIVALADDVFGYMKWRVLDPFVAPGARSLAPATTDAVLDRYEDHLLSRIQPESTATDCRLG
ncbi:MAG: NAD(P)H-dependent oxidoreductase [Thermoanaerobaculia bacterium]|nr:NAD(P)H-dependent oxidoreductase [Thermoanaerobaculia bacterium]